MRYNKIFKYACFLLLTVGLLACDNKFEEINDNPNSPTDAPAELILPGAQRDAVDEIYQMGGLNGYVGSVFAQGYSKIQYVDEDAYDFSGRITLIDAIWEEFYTSPLEDLKQIKIKARASDSPNVEAIGRIMQTWIYQVMTDTWGYIPYKEALKGLQKDPVVQPAYSSQKEIYDSMIDTLQAAVNQINVNSSPFGSADIIYGGDMAKWKKFGYSLMARIYMRQAKVRPDVAESGIQSIWQNNKNWLFQSNADNAALAYKPFPNNNPVNNFQIDRQDHRVSKTIEDTLNALNDPRIRIYAAPVLDKSLCSSEETKANGNCFHGIINGDKGIQERVSLAQASDLGAFFQSPTSPGRLMTYPEVKFIIAEAATRGWIGKDAETAYEEAIRASMEMYNPSRVDAVLSNFTASNGAYTKHSFGEKGFPDGIEDSEITSYLNQPGVQFAGNQGDQLDQIALQKWISLYGQGLEMWFTFRKFDQPNLTPGPDALVQSTVPLRLYYPTDEEALNGENYDAAFNAQNIPKDAQYTEQFTHPVWWDK